MSSASDSKPETGKRAVYLDRDGVINQTFHRNGKPRAPQTLLEFEYLPGVVEAVQRLKAAGFAIIVVTNQPDVARGWQKREIVDSMNEKVLRELNVDGLKVCFHVSADGCECRKPKPGMLMEAALELEIDLKRSYMVGDRFSDIRAGQEAGCVSILVGAGDLTEASATPNLQVSSLLEAAEWILAEDLAKMAQFR